MKKLLLITAVLMFSSLLSKAQDNLPHKSQPDSLIKIIPVELGDNSTYLYTIGGKLQTAEDVKIRLLRYAPSAFEYHKAKNSVAWTWVSFGGLAASGFASLIEFKNNNKNAGVTSAIINGQAVFVYQHHNLTGAYVFTGLATGFLISSFVNLAHAAMHGNKAIKLYNQQYQ